MALKKTIAAYYHPEKGWTPQQDIDMHPLEEKEMLAHWAIGDASMKIPPKPMLYDEQEWLIQYGADYVKQKRDEWQKAHDAAQPELQAAINNHKEHEKNWHSHIEKCVANGLCPNTTEEGAYTPVVK